VATDEQTGYAEWSILELMGHRRLGGFVRAVQVAGAGMLRIDVPGDVDGDTHSTQFYPPSSVYCLTPVSEAAARIVAKSSRPEPVSRWELPQPKAADKNCPGCGESHGGLCRNCGERHPCACMEQVDDDDDDSAPNIPF